MNKCPTCPFYERKSSYGFTTLRCGNEECEHYQKPIWKERITESGYVYYIPTYTEKQNERQ